MNIINISDCELLAKGGTRLIYQNPINKNKIFKVNINIEDRLKLHPIKKVIRFIAPSTKLRDIKIESQAYINYFISIPEVASSIFPCFFGFTHTSFGLAICYEKLSDSKGNMAPTLLQIVQNGEYSKVHKIALNSLVKTLKNNHIIQNDFSPKNFVFANDKFYIVDGLGDKHVVRIRTISRSINNIYILKKTRRLAKKLNLSYNLVSGNFI